MRASSRTSSRKRPSKHAEWVREHPRIDDSAFPEYPDEKSRRGSSRGALPNGNPWYAEREGEKPGRRPPRAVERASGTVRVIAPPRGSARLTVTLAAEVAKRLAESKSFDGRCVEVSLLGKEVVLRGHLLTLAAKLEAGLLASSVRGVSHVLNEIRIDADV